MKVENLLLWKNKNNESNFFIHVEADFYRSISKIHFLTITVVKSSLTFGNAFSVFILIQRIQFLQRKSNETDWNVGEFQKQRNHWLGVLAIYTFHYFSHYLANFMDLRKRAKNKSGINNNNPRVFLYILQLLLGRSNKQSYEFENWNFKVADPSECFNVMSQFMFFICSIRSSHANCPYTCLYRNFLCLSAWLSHVWKHHHL